MYHTIIKSFLVSLVSISLIACAGFFDKDNLPKPGPLPPDTAEVKTRFLWSSTTGAGVGNEFLKESPALGETAIFTASLRGTVTAVNKHNGKLNWQVNTHVAISSGVGIGECILVVGGAAGEVIALRQEDGVEIWRTCVPGEILARPAISHGVVIVKTVNGILYALSSADGKELWTFHQYEPNLILRGSSSPLIRGHNVIVGFANGNLIRLDLRDGQLRWLKTIALSEGSFAVQRMIDVEADPIVFDHRIFAATYQGNIASLDWTSGKVLWSHSISSYTGMTADEEAVYISDAKSHLWAFNADTGLVIWRQVQLQHRGLTAPEMMCDYIVVGDAEGFLHWVSKDDGHLAARVSVGGHLFSAPLVDSNIVYAVTNSGYVAAYEVLNSPA